MAKYENTNPLEKLYVGEPYFLLRSQAQANERFPNESVCHCVCMVVDWMAMGLHYGDTAEDYYNRKKHEINLPEWADKFVREIFARLNGSYTPP